MTAGDGPDRFGSSPIYKPQPGFSWLGSSRFRVSSVGDSTRRITAIIHRVETGEPNDETSRCPQSSSSTPKNECREAQSVVSAVGVRVRVRPSCRTRRRPAVVGRNRTHRGQPLRPRRLSVALYHARKLREQWWNPSRAHLCHPYNHNSTNTDHNGTANDHNNHDDDPAAAYTSATVREQRRGMDDLRVLASTKLPSG